MLCECEIREKISNKTGNPYNVLAVKVIDNPPSWIEFFCSSEQLALISVGQALSK